MDSIIEINQNTNVINKPLFIDASITSNELSTQLQSDPYYYMIQIFGPSDVTMNETNTIDASEIAKKEKHRHTERKRHRNILELIKQLNETMGVNQRRETQNYTLNRAARYCNYLASVAESLENQLRLNDAANDTFNWFSEMSVLYDLYRKAYEKVAKQKLNVTEDIIKEKFKLIKNALIVCENKSTDDIHTPEKNVKVINGLKRSSENDHRLPLKKRAKMIMFQM